MPKMPVPRASPGIGPGAVLSPYRALPAFRTGRACAGLVKFLRSGIPLRFSDTSGVVMIRMEDGKIAEHWDPALKQ